jgi:hypothetical protein
MDFPEYPPVLALERRLDILEVKRVVITEKLHGSTFRIHFPAGMSSISEIRFGSHEMLYVPGRNVPGQPFPLGNVVRWFEKRPELLTAMWETIKSYGFGNATVFGEACGPGIHAKGVKYSDGQELLFRAFAVMVERCFLSHYDLFCEVTEKMGLPRVPEIVRAEPSRELFDSLLERPSIEAQRNGIADAANIHEGIVIQADPFFRDTFGEYLIAKHKSARFAEKAKAAVAKPVRGPSAADDFAAMYVTAGRLTNAVGRLHDRGVALASAMTDMPTLLKEMVADLHKECGAEMADLGISDDKQLQGAVSRILGPLYRAMLAGQKGEEG